MSTGLSTVTLKENVFLSCQNGCEVVKVGDFDSSRMFLSSNNPQETEEDVSACGTPLFMAPEVIQGVAGDYLISTPSDIWSYGCLVLQLANKGQITLLATADENNALAETHLWTHENGTAMAAYAVATGATPKFPHHAIISKSDPLAILAEECWHPDPERRPAAEQLLDSFKEIFDDDVTKPFYSAACSAAVDVPQGLEVIPVESALSGIRKGHWGGIDIAFPEDDYQSMITFVEVFIELGKQPRHRNMLYPQAIIGEGNGLALVQDDDKQRHLQITRCRNVLWEKPHENSCVPVAATWEDIVHLMTKIDRLKDQRPEHIMLWFDALCQQLHNLCEYLQNLKMDEVAACRLNLDCFLRLPDATRYPMRLPDTTFDSTSTVLVQARIIPHQNNRRFPLNALHSVCRELEFWEQTIWAIVTLEDWEEGVKTTAYIPTSETFIEKSYTVSHRKRTLESQLERYLVELAAQWW
ncbi:uncharacterized protein LOC129581915 [Paramacrobiotus metropolitanus]|uniref:uncharacterized protein LOC129581915 n=1 Tax=Paramacrobiotus metropolitanus TaxID=2943436 RepID=UPI002445E61A|nr:uncharacterized protein LOC129581915 [Paramacrobiotus metropolitanus]XP_055329188.1 uncharacterized protein LOC129581915 [Paramacrobiotus metropolitanus]XP_055329189.1 uncharacterized protein LOC129581915 [Paramacrobiotus metropolitanus]